MKSYFLKNAKTIHIATIVVAFIFSFLPRQATSQCINTIAGNGIPTHSGDGGPATSASIYFPQGLAQDVNHNLYLTDVSGYIRRVDAVTGIITSVIGNGSQTLGFNGDNIPATSAVIGVPLCVVLDGSGNIYISTEDAAGAPVNTNERIRKINAVTGIITTYAGTGVSGFFGDGGLATSAQIDTIIGMAFDAANNLYFSSGRNRIRRIDASTGIITTVAGTGVSGFSGDSGPATSAQLSSPFGMAIDISGNIYIGDGGNNRIRKIAAATGIITTVAGNGTAGFSGDGGLAINAEFSHPSCPSIDSLGNLYIADHNNSRIRKIDAASSIVTTIAGTGALGFSGDGGPAINAALYFPTDIIFDGVNLIFSDANNFRIRKIFEGGADAHLPALSTPATVVQPDSCIDFEGYTGYLNPSNLNRKWANINIEGNNSCSFTVTVDPSRTSYQMKTDGFSHTTVLMPRMLNVITSGCTPPFSINGGMRVRMYYSISEQAAAIAALDPAVPGTNQWAWFKYEGTQNNVVANQTYDQFTGLYSYLTTPDSSGAEDGINFVEFWHVTTFSTFGGLAYKNNINTLLPISLSDFSAVATNSHTTKLNWITNDQNIDSIIIERSSANGTVFNEIGSLPANNSSSSTNYNYIDNNPMQGINYYRLKIVDDDGNYMYSDIRSVIFSVSVYLSVWPNPTKDEVNITGLAAGNNSLRLFDVSGKIIAEQISGGGSAHINMGNLPAGIYILRVQGPDGNTNEIKVVKQ